MKKIIFIAMFLMIAGSGFIYPQWIDLIKIDPPNPTSADTISVYVFVSFPSGSCDQKTQIMTISLPHIAGNSLHCLGMLTVICPDIDTFKVGVLPAGTYTFVYHVNAGSLPSPCTPGIVPGPTDSIIFTVTPALGISSNGNGNEDFIITPNPAQQKVNLNLSNKLTNDQNKSLLIYSMTGQKNERINITDASAPIDISGLAAGVYYCKIEGDHFQSKWQKMIIVK